MKKILISLILFLSPNVNSSEIVKEVSFTTDKNFSNCGIATGKYIFYSDSDFDLFWYCPANPEPDIYTGTWKNLSENSNLFHHILTDYTYDGIKYQDTIKLQTDFLTISWNGGSENYYKYIDLSKNEITENSKNDPKDLKGTNLFCYGDNTAYSDNTNTFVQEYVAFTFIDNLKVVYSYLLIEDKIKNSNWTRYNLIFDYEVFDEEIIVYTGLEARFHFDTTIDRYDLKLYGHYNPYESAPECKTVNYDPLEEIKEVYKEREKKL